MKLLKVFVVANSGTYNEWAVLKSIKYQDAFDFKWEFTQILNEAQIVIWDGIKNRRSEHMFSDVEKKISSEGHILIWMRSPDFFEEFHNKCRLNLDQVRYLEINVTNASPEKMIWALNEAKKKLVHV